MERELLLEIGCEELPAAWLVPLAAQLADRLRARLVGLRLATDAPIEAHATPRRLAVVAPRIAERQPDLDETISGPPISAGFTADGTPTPAAIGFAKKQGVEVGDLTRVETPKGTYLAYVKKQRGKTAVDVLPELLAGVLRDLTFPKQMRWDAWIEDGRGEFPFGRPIRWLLFLYGGRVVPFTIRRTSVASSPLVQDIRTGAITYGHRFLSVSGRPGRAVKVRSFSDYKARLAEHFVLLDRSERQARITRELDVHARRLAGRVNSAAVSQSGTLQEVADLVEYPAVVAGAFAADFLALPEEVLTTTMIHHQHFFPVVDDAGRLMPAFLAVTNVEVDNPRKIAVNAERVLAARLRDARFFWDADRQHTLASRWNRLDTLLFHKALGSYRAKAERLASLAEWLARDAFGAEAEASHARVAGEWAKVDLVSDMVREFTELQGTMGGIYAREEGQPEAVWKAIYYQYLPVGVEAGGPPTREQLGAGAVTWAAVSLADKLDSVVGLFSAGERPTGTRDPFGLRRQVQGALKVLTDLPEVAGIDRSLTIEALVDRAGAALGTPVDGFRDELMTFVTDRLRHLFGQRGYRPGEIDAALGAATTGVAPLAARRRLEALQAMRGSEDFTGLSVVFKRVKNIAREISDAPKARYDHALDRSVLTEPAEQALLGECDRRAPGIREALAGERYRQAMVEAAALRPVVDRFFDEVFVMAEDPRLRTARLMLMVELRDLVMQIADISQLGG
jgi:glycyl-tRNA synthetase beta chain